MEQKNGVPIEEIHKEIDLIQSCIKRMASNSFMLKGWAITIYAVVLALLPESINMILLCTVLITVTCAFWYLDGFFLKTEKLYRNIYDWVLLERPKGNRELLYQLNPKMFTGKIPKTGSTREIMLSVTLRTFYGIPIIMNILILVFNIISSICTHRICGAI